MNSIGDFFSKFRNLALVELRKREMIKDSFEKITHQKIDVKDISIKDGILNIKGSAALKSEIFMKKSKIIELLSKNLPTLKIKDIK